MDLKKKITTIILIDTEKVFDKIQHKFIIIEWRTSGKISQHNRSYVGETNSQHHFTWRRALSNPTEVRNETGLSPFPFVFNVVLEKALDGAISLRTKSEGIQIGKEAKLSRFADDILYALEIPKILPENF